MLLARSDSANRWLLGKELLAALGLPVMGKARTRHSVWQSRTACCNEACDAALNREQAEHWSTWLWKRALTCLNLVLSGLCGIAR